MLTTACSFAPDYRTKAQEITDAMAEHPGVTRATHQYANSYTMGYRYRLELTVSSVEPATLDAVTGAYVDLVGRDGLRGHDLDLELIRGDDSILIHGSRGAGLDPGALAATWSQTVQAVPGTVLISAIGSEIFYVNLDVTDLPSTLDQLRTRLPQLDQVDWRIRLEGLTLQLMGGYPDQATAEALAALPATVIDRRSWSFTYDPSATPALRSISRNNEKGDEIEAQARERLDALAALGIPILHTEDLPDRQTLDVFLGGCTTDGSELQQQLNREYGTC